MPIKVAQGLPAIEQLMDEGVNVIRETKALKQDIRPLRIAILNLMPLKETTEMQFLRLIGGSPLQIEVDFLHTQTYKSKNVSSNHLEQFYKTFEEIEDFFYDGLIITGAPVEQIAFEEVDYYDELIKILKWSETNVYSRFFICWAAQVSLNYYYGIEREHLPKKLFGIYSYPLKKPNSPYLRGFDDAYSIPVSRHTTMNETQIEAEKDLVILSKRPDFGPDLVGSVDARDLFIFGHLEYSRYTLELEYQRDKEKGLAIQIPKNYYPEDDYTSKPIVSWRSHAYILFNNWLNETYQNTRYDLTQLKEIDKRVVRSQK